MNGERANWGIMFASEMKHKGIKFSVKPIQGSRLHIYSHSALRTFPYLHELQCFIQGQKDSWTKKYLLDSIGSEKMKGELKVLGLYGFIIGEPITAYHNLLSVADAHQILNVTASLLTQSQTSTLTEFSNFDYLWNVFLLLPTLRIRDDHHKIHRDLQKKAQKNFETLLLSWSPIDSLLWNKVIPAVQTELVKLSKEYREKELEPSCFAFPSTSVSLERQIAMVKFEDSRRDHKSIRTLETNRMYTDFVVNQSSPHQFTDTDLRIIRKEARKLEGTAKIEQRLHDESRIRKITKEEKQKVTKERKRKYDEEIQKKLENVSIITNADLIMKLRGQDLDLQLRKRQKTHPQIIKLSRKAVEKRQLLLKCLNAPSYIEETNDEAASRGVSRTDDIEVEEEKEKEEHQTRSTIFQNIVENSVLDRSTRQRKPQVRMDL